MYHIYLDEDLDEVIDRVKQELCIKEEVNVDPSDCGNDSRDE